METTKVWFITGASSGFGRAFSEYAIGKGYRVVVTARRFEKLAAIQALAPHQVEAIQMDVNNPQAVERAVAQAMKRFGRIDVLINNAGYAIVGAVEETPEKELRAQMETNFFGAVAVTERYFPSCGSSSPGPSSTSAAWVGRCRGPALGRTLPLNLP
jgi:NADP-dependent 3-hydroxy acid dehydrogenase YdfG